MSPYFTYQQLDLLILVDRAKLFAHDYGTRRSRSCRGRNCRRRSIAFKQHWNHRTLSFFHEREFAFAEHIHTHEVAELHLSGGNEIRQREYQMAFDSALQMPRSVLRIGAFAEQELFHRRRAIENELMRARCHEHALLHHAKFDIENLLQVFRTQRLEHYYLVDAVHELRSKLAARGINRRARDLLVERVVDLHRFWCKTQAAIDQAVHLGCAEVRGHNDDAARKIHAAIVAERERGFGEDAKQQLPERVRGFLDLVEKQDRELQLLGVPLVERFLSQKRMRLAVAQVSGRRA